MRFPPTLILALFASVALGDELQFNRDVRPILSNHCFTCHGPDSATREAGLRLDLRDAAIATGDSGARGIVPGDVNASAIIQRVTSTDPDVRMPPTDGPKALDQNQIATLKKWIESGATYQSHWAFLPVTKPAVPDAAVWAPNPP